ncbi:cell wall metabolism sensor histidine kinase WalK [Cohnella sp. WQ 127256]|uniref:sensor histidine kinase n=1 Tax=Cohnella sp. WQ 127256 TaxID=2938790 RepID=UPI0021182EA9|nr:HAMP domain-containing sensor histidine kinase [Cohnella sp. WQ 127256]
MFNKLRNRFLIVNLVIISFMMLLAFASIYTITYQNVRSDIESELHSVSEFYRKQDGKLGEPRQGLGGDHLPQLSKGKANPPPERSVSFSLQTDEQWNIIATDSRFDMDSEFYELAIDKAASDPTKNGPFTLDGNRWAYTVQQNQAGYSIVYLDVTAQQKIVTNLIYTFAVVGLVMLIVIFFTSRFFANRSIQPVKEAFDKQKQFIADASHELKTPLAVINTNADVLLSNSEDTIHNQSKWLHRIKSETERMKTLTNDLLYLTEMDDSRASMIFTNFNVSEAVEGIILTMEAVMFEKDISLSYKIEPNLTVRGNNEQIKQVVMILLDNGIKYTNSKGSIALTLKKSHNDILLTVTNTGEGIPPEHLERIFDRFYRADASRSRKQGGYGLGLAIAKSIIEQHKGRIYARSVPNETTSFYVQLP